MKWTAAITSFLFIGFASNAFTQLSKKDFDPLEGVIECSKVRFTQDSISDTFSDGGKVKDAIEEIREGKLDLLDFPPLQIFIKNGVIYSLDNRRLFLCQHVGGKIRYELVTDYSTIEQQFFKFTTKNDGKEIWLRPTPVKQHKKPARK